MNAANESSLAPSLRRLPFSVRLAPHFVNCLSAVLPEDDFSEEIEGLLFGIVETGFSVLRMFHLSSPITGIGRQANFEELLTKSKKNPQLAGFTLLGWFATRNTDGLHADDIAFHELNFKKSNDLALIVKIEPESQLLFELYCRTPDGTFTTENYRSGTIQIPSTSPVVSPVEVSLEAHRAAHLSNLLVAREVEDDDSFAFLREAFASSTKKAFDLLKTGKPEHWEQVPDRLADSPITREPDPSLSRPSSAAFGTSGGAAAAPARISEEKPPAPQPVDLKGENLRRDEPERTIPVDAPKRPAPTPFTTDAVLVRPENYRAPSSANPANPHIASPEVRPFQAETRENEAPELTFGVKAARPALLSRFPSQMVGALPWRILAVIFVLVTGGTFALIYLRGAHANGTLPQFVQALWPTPGLDLKIASNGDRFQLSWNRNMPAVRNAREAILEINDGPNRHQIYLGNSELGNGSVLYLPTSDDVVFRLQVHGAAGQDATESLRVIGTAKSKVLEVSRPGETADGEPEVPATVASNRPATDKAKRNAVSNRPSAGTKLERARREESRPATSARAMTTADLPPARSAPSVPPSVHKTDTPDTTRASAKPPAANPTTVTPPPSNNPPNAEAQAAPRSDLSNPTPRQGTNNAETAQLTKPAEPIVQPENNFRESAPAQVPAPARIPPVKTESTGTQPAVAYRPPRALKQVLPKLGALAPGLADSVTEVRVVVRVNESGQVIDARVLEGRNKIGSMLAGASLTAARQWIFEPASLRGKNIESEHTIVFQFRH